MPTDDALVVGQVRAVFEAAFTIERVRVPLAPGNDFIDRQAKARVRVADRGPVALVALVQVRGRKVQAVEHLRPLRVLGTHEAVQVEAGLADRATVLVRVPLAAVQGALGALGAGFQEKAVEANRAGDRVCRPIIFKAVAHGGHAKLGGRVGREPEVAGFAAVRVDRVFDALLDALEVPLQARAVVHVKLGAALDAGVGQLEGVLDAVGDGHRLQALGLVVAQVVLVFALSAERLVRVLGAVLDFGVGVLEAVELGREDEVVLAGLALVEVEELPAVVDGLVDAELEGVVLEVPELDQQQAFEVPGQVGHVAGRDRHVVVPLPRKGVEFARVDQILEIRGFSLYIGSILFRTKRFRKRSSNKGFT